LIGCVPDTTSICDDGDHSDSDDSDDDNGAEGVAERDARAVVAEYATLAFLDFFVAGGVALVDLLAIADSNDEAVDSLAAAMDIA